MISARQGVEIEVTPAGKATRRLSLLSGGEKALVALAFVFAVFLARPSPFYILDEVEAALDDANIDRFLQLVRRFSDRAQFVIVTHQKRTMDAADVLYGVSMGKGGITKVISRRLSHADEAPAEARGRLHRGRVTCRADGQRAGAKHSTSARPCRPRQGDDGPVRGTRRGGCFGACARASPRAARRCRPSSARASSSSSTTRPGSGSRRR